ncbi:MAG: hypothetical protein F4X97_13090 [Boseongicola sp. SB0662_bin_57]|nr:hypothetical protein [Boseongicola sp. SB0662_bin_57]
MTVLAKYQRLEAEGIWRRSPGEQRRDVIVSVGKTTITISTPTEITLTHWSLPAMERMNPGHMPALYCPEGDASETLELAEDAFVEAVERVLESVRRRQGRSGRVRRFFAIGLLIAVLGGAALWLPGAIARHTASLLPDVARASIGTSLLSEMDRMTGPPCDAPSGIRALEHLQDRLFGVRAVRLVVLPSTLPESAHLPGGTILLAHKLLKEMETPEILAVHVLAEDIRRGYSDPVARLLHVAGIKAVLVLLTQGTVPDEAVARMAEHVVTTVPSPVPTDVLKDRVTAVGMTIRDSANLDDAPDQSTATVAAAVAPATLPILDDGHWIALQGICEE